MRCINVHQGFLEEKQKAGEKSHLPTGRDRGGGELLVAVE
jgi:hypothetical protein